MAGFRLRATKGLSGRPLETFGARNYKGLGIFKGGPPCGGPGGFDGPAWKTLVLPSRNRYRNHGFQSHVQPRREAMQTKTLPPAGTSRLHRLGFSSGTSPMCNHAAKPYLTRTTPPAGHSPVPMEVDDRPCEAVLAGDSAIATHNMLCHGGPGGGWPSRLNSAAPRPLCYFLRGESRALMKQSLARENHPCKALFLKAGIRAAARPKGFPIALWKPSGPATIRD